MMKIRLAKEQDLAFIKATYQKLDEAMMNLYSEIIKFDTQENDGADLHIDEYWTRLINKESGYILIGMVDETQAGMAVVENVDAQECHLEDLYVYEQYRNQGIGKKLIHEAKRIAAETGFINISLNVLPNNANAREIYKEFGFVDTRIRMNCKL